MGVLPDLGKFAIKDNTTSDLPDLTKYAIKNNPRSLSQDDLERVLRTAGFAEKDIPKMSAIGMGEAAKDPSDPTRVLLNSHNPGHGPHGTHTNEDSLGLFQINMLPSLGRTYDREKLVSDPVYNAKAAKEIFDKSRRSNPFDEWGAHSNGSYRQYLRNKVAEGTWDGSAVDTPDYTDAPQIDPPKVELRDQQVPNQSGSLSSFPDQETLRKRFTKGPGDQSSYTAPMDQPAPDIDPTQKALLDKYNSWIAENKKPNNQESIAEFNQTLQTTATSMLADKGITNPAVQQVATSQVPRLEPKTVQKATKGYTEDDFKQWADFTGSDTSDTSRQKFEADLKANSAPIGLQTQVTELNDGQNDLKIGQEKGNPPDAIHPNKSAYSVVNTQPVDLSNKPKGVPTGDWLIEQAANQLQAEYDNKLDVQKGLNYLRNKYGSVSQGFNDVTDQDIADYKKAGRDTNIPVNLSGELVSAMLGGDDKNLSPDVAFRIKNQSQLRGEDQQNFEQQPPVLSDPTYERPNGLSEEEAKKKLEEMVSTPKWQAQNIASKILAGAMGMAGNPLGQLYGDLTDKNSLINSPGQSDPELVNQELEKLRSSNGSYSAALDNEYHWQGMSNPELIGRVGKQTVQSYLKNVVSGTAKGLATVLQDIEDYDPANYFAKKATGQNISPLKETGALFDFLTRSVTAPDFKDAWDGYQKTREGIDKGGLAENPAFKVWSAFDDAIGDDPYIKDKFVGQFADSVGSMLAFMSTALIAPEASSELKLGKYKTEFGWPSAIFGGISQTGSAYEEGKKSGLTEDQARLYSIAQFAGGLTEGFGIGGELHSLIKDPEIRKSLFKSLVSIGKEALKGGGEEFVQEVTQDVWGNTALDALKDKDPSAYNRVINILKDIPTQLTKVIPNEGVLAFLSAGLMGGAGKAVQLHTSEHPTITLDSKVYDVPKPLLEQYSTLAEKEAEYEDKLKDLGKAPRLGSAEYKGISNDKTTVNITGRPQEVETKGSVKYEAPNQSKLDEYNEKLKSLIDEGSKLTQQKNELENQIRSHYGLDSQEQVAQSKNIKESIGEQARNFGVQSEGTFAGLTAPEREQLINQKQSELKVGDPVWVKGKGYGVITDEQKSNNNSKSDKWVVEYNPKQGKDGEITYQSRSIYQKRNVYAQGFNEFEQETPNSTPKAEKTTAPKVEKKTKVQEMVDNGVGHSGLAIEPKNNGIFEPPVEPQSEFQSKSKAEKEKIIRKSTKEATQVATPEVTQVETPTGTTTKVETPKVTIRRKEGTPAAKQGKPKEVKLVKTGKNQFPVKDTGEFIPNNIAEKAHRVYMEKTKGTKYALANIKSTGGFTSAELTKLYPRWREDAISQQPVLRNSDYEVTSEKTTEDDTQVENQDTTSLKKADLPDLSHHDVRITDPNRLLNQYPLTFTPGRVLSDLTDPNMVKLRGKMVSKQQVEQLIKRGKTDIGKQILSDVLKDFGTKFNYSDYEATVNLAVMPLQRMYTYTHADYGIENFRGLLDHKTQKVSTYIFNAPFDTGYWGHWGELSGQVSQFKLTEIKGENGQHLYVIKEVHDFPSQRQDPIDDGLFVTDDKKAAEDLFEKLKTQGRNVGVFGHTRPWEDKKDGIHRVFLAEAQLEGLQMIRYPGSYSSKLKFPGISNWGNTYNSKKLVGVSSGEELMINHIIQNLKNYPEEVQKAGNRLIESVRRIEEQARKVEFSFNRKLSDLIIKGFTDPTMSLSLKQEYQRSFMDYRSLAKWSNSPLVKELKSDLLDFQHGLKTDFQKAVDRGEIKLFVDTPGWSSNAYGRAKDYMDLMIKNNSEDYEVGNIYNYNTSQYEYFVHKTYGIVPLNRLSPEQQEKANEIDESIAKVLEPIQKENTFVYNKLGSVFRANRDKVDQIDQRIQQAIDSSKINFKANKDQYDRYLATESDPLVKKTMFLVNSFQQQMKDFTKYFDLKQKQFVAYQKYGQQALIREAIKRAAVEGAKEMYFPTGPTLALIEGYIDPRPKVDLPYNNSENKEQLETGDEITSKDYNTRYLVIKSDANTISVLSLGEVGTSKDMRPDLYLPKMFANLVQNFGEKLESDNSSIKPKDIPKAFELLGFPVDIAKKIVKDYVDNVYDLYSDVNKDGELNALDYFFRDMGTFIAKEIRSRVEAIQNAIISEDKTPEENKKAVREMLQKEFPNIKYSDYTYEDGYDDITNYTVAYSKWSEPKVFGQPGTYTTESNEMDKNTLLSKINNPGHQTVVKRYYDLANWLKKERKDLTDYYDTKTRTWWYKTELTSNDKNAPITVFKVENKAKASAERKRLAAIPRINEELITGVTSKRVNGNLKVSKEAIEILRRIEAQHYLNVTGKEGNIPTFSAAMWREEQLTNFLPLLKQLGIDLKGAGYTKEDLKGLTKLVKDLESFDKSAVIYDDNDSVGHEKIHQVRYAASVFEDTISKYYRNFDKLYASLEDIHKDAYNNYMKEAYFNGKDYNSLTKLEKQIHHEEVFTHIADGEWEKLGLTDEQAEKFVKADLKAFEEAHPGAFEHIKEFVDERINQTGLAEFLANSEPRKTGTGVSKGKTGKQTGTAASVAGDKAQAGSSQQSKVRRSNRATPQTIAQNTLLNLDKLGDHTITYETSNRNLRAKEAEQWLNGRQFDDAYTEALAAPVSAEGTARRMAVLEYIDSQVEKYQTSDPHRSNLWLEKMADFTNKIAPSQTEYGQAISQWARWAVELNPEGVVPFVMGKGAKLNPTEQQNLRNLAKIARDTDERISSLEAKLRDTLGLGDKDLLNELKPTEKALINKVRKAFGPIKNFNILTLKLTGWHGGHAGITKFSNDKIGTGEGAQVYGYGHYFASKEEIARFYKDSLRNEAYITSGDNSRIYAPGMLAKDFNIDLNLVYNVLEDLSEIPNLSGEILDDKIIEAGRDLNQAIYEAKDLEKKLDSEGVIAAHDDEWNDLQYEIEDTSARLEILNFLKEKDGSITQEKRSALYKVKLKPKENEYLLWDKPFEEQPDNVKKALKKIQQKVGGTYIELDRHIQHGPYAGKDKPGGPFTRKDIYHSLVDYFTDQFDNYTDQYIDPETGAVEIPKDDTSDIANKRSDQLASELLLKYGIRGNKYLDGTSRKKGEGSHNYVIFDPEDVEVKQVFHKVDDHSISDFEPDLRNTLIGLGTIKHLENTSQSFDDWQKSLENQLSGEGIDVSQLDGYWKDLYKKVNDKIKTDRRNNEIARAKVKYNVTSTGEALAKLADEREERQKKSKVRAENRKILKGDKDKRTITDIAIDNQLSGSNLTREDIYDAKDKTKFYQKNADSGMSINDIHSKYIEAIDIYHKATTDIKEERENQKVQSLLSPPGIIRHHDIKEKQRLLNEIDQAKRDKLKASQELRSNIRYLTERPQSKAEQLQNWYLRVNSMGEALLTATLKTAMHNILAQRATKLINAVETGVELAIAKTHLLKEGDLGIPAEASFRKLLEEEVKSSSIPAIRKALDQYRDGTIGLSSVLQTIMAHKDRVVQGILVYNPDLYERMVGQFSFGMHHHEGQPIDTDRLGKVGQTVEKGVRGMEWLTSKATKLNEIQELHFRFATFLGSVATDLHSQGYDLEQIINSNNQKQIPKHILERAVKRALEDTFGEDIPKSGPSGLISTASSYAKWIPFPLNPLLFRRFFFNSQKFVFSHTPLIFAKFLRKENREIGVTNRDIAKVITGTSTLLMAMGLLGAFGSDDDDPTQLKIMGKTIKMSAYNPLSNYLILAHIIKQGAKGIGPGTEDAWRLFGIDSRYPNPALEYYKTLYDLMGDEDAKYIKWGDQTKIIGGKGVAAFLRPFTSLKDIEAQFDSEEQNIPEGYEEPFMNEVKKDIPVANKLTKLFTGDLPKYRIDPLTDQPIKKNSPLLDQLGLTFVPENQIGAKFSPAEAFLDEAVRGDRAQFKKFYKTPDEKRTSATLAMMYSAIDKGKDIKKTIDEYYKAGKLSKEQASKLYHANSIQSTIERKANDATIPEIVDSMWLANEDERKILKNVLYRKARTQRDRGTLSEDEIKLLKSQIDW